MCPSCMRLQRRSSVREDKRKHEDTLDIRQPEQISFLLIQGKQLLDKLDFDGEDIVSAAQNYIFMEGYQKYLEEQ